MIFNLIFTEKDSQWEIAMDIFLFLMQFLKKQQKKLQIFKRKNIKKKKINKIKNRHDSSIWGVSWSHPRFGNLLATCGFDRKILIWKENNHKWEKIYEYSEHKNSVNCVSFANHEFGLILVAGSSDGNISLHEYKSKKINQNILINFKKLKR